MSDSTASNHHLTLEKGTVYVTPICSCGWRGDRRRQTNTTRATLDGSHHVAKDHMLATDCDPTIFTPRRVRGSCFCDWKGEWYDRIDNGGDPLAYQKAHDDAQEHRRLVLDNAWNGAAGRKGTDL